MAITAAVAAMHSAAQECWRKERGGWQSKRRSLCKKYAKRKWKDIEKGIEKREKESIGRDVKMG